MTVHPSPQMTIRELPAPTRRCVRCGALLSGDGTHGDSGLYSCGFGDAA